jgi:hypothetical protein
MLVAVLITYALLARRHEAVACGRAARRHRLMLRGRYSPLIGGCPDGASSCHSERQQDALRAKIREGSTRDYGHGPSVSPD